MDLFGQVVRCLIELTSLGCALIANGMRSRPSLCTKSRAALTAENLFLRKQLAFYQERKVVPRRFDNGSRYLLVLLSRRFAWKDALINVTPKTLIGWHRAGFRLFWRWKCRRGRPRMPPELRALISQMARDNVTW